MKTTILALSLLAVSASSMASIKGYKFVAKDDSAPTNLCVISAKEGLKAAQKIDREGLFSIRCNGKNIQEFAKQFQTTTKTVAASEKRATKYKVVPVNSKAESLICAKAASEGVRALNIASDELRKISCNGLSVRSFARTYFNQ